MRTPEGEGYDQQLGGEFFPKYIENLGQCTKEAGNDLDSFWFLLKLDKGGTVTAALLCSPRDSTNLDYAPALFEKLDTASASVL